MGPARALARTGAVHTRHYIEANLLGVIASEKCRAGGPAAARVVKLRVANAVGGKCVEVGRDDLAAVTTGVGETHIVGEEYHEIGWPSAGLGAQRVRDIHCAKC